VEVEMGNWRGVKARVVTEMSDKPEGSIMKVLATLVSAGLFLGLAVSASATVLHVPSEYPTIQAGIDAGVDGDTVLVANGAYTGDGNRDIDFWGKAIVVMSEKGAEVTIIDCQGSETTPHRGFYLHSGEWSSSVVQGFTIKNGCDFDGGGIYVENSAPVIRENRIINNTLAEWYFYGAGICCRNAAPHILWNLVAYNTFAYEGGGIYLDGGLTVGDSTIFAVVRGNTIVGNETFSGWGISHGAGVHSNAGSPLIVGNVLAGNIVDCGDGGGFGCSYSSPILIGNTFTDNRSGGGGAILCHFNSSPTVLNSVLWGDDTFEGSEIIVGPASSITVTYSDIEGGWTGEGNIDEDPIFVLADRQDYRLLWGSSCIDAGHPDSLDPDGTRSDIGALHFNQDDYLTVYLTPYDTTIPPYPYGHLEVTYTVINRWPQPEPFWVLTEAILPNGNPVTVFGPDHHVLPATTTIQRHVTHDVPPAAPSGYYEYRTRIGVPPSTLYDGDRFTFRVL
jgi:hypothetical protein